MLKHKHASVVRSLFAMKIAKQFPQEGVHTVTVVPLQRCLQIWYGVWLYMAFIAGLSIYTYDYFHFISGEMDA